MTKERVGAALVFGVGFFLLSLLGDNDSIAVSVVIGVVAGVVYAAALYFLRWRHD